MVSKGQFVGLDWNLHHAAAEHPTRSRRVVDSNPIWDSDFFPSVLFSLHLISL